MTRLTPVSMMLVALCVLPAMALGHPPAADPHRACVQPWWQQAAPAPTVVVQRTLSYLAPSGASLACGPTSTAEFGSHAAACPALPFVGAIAGAFCGPLVGGGAAITCTWSPGFNSVPTRLIIGFDNAGAGVVVPTAPVWGPFGPGAWTVPNPYATPARVIAFPTNVAMPPDPAAGAMAPGDWNNVIC